MMIRNTEINKGEVIIFPFTNSKFFQSNVYLAVCCLNRLVYSIEVNADKKVVGSMNLEYLCRAESGFSDSYKRIIDTPYFVVFLIPN